eukprot:scaffold53724_cov36-Tisochrysis_lutea.AAC.2
MPRSSTRACAERMVAGALLCTQNYVVAHIFDWVRMTYYGQRPCDLSLSFVFFHRCNRAFGGNCVKVIGGLC